MAVRGKFKVKLFQNRYAVINQITGEMALVDRYDQRIVSPMDLEGRRALYDTREKARRVCDRLNTP